MTSEKKAPSIEERARTFVTKLFAADWDGANAMLDDKRRAEGSMSEWQSILAGLGKFRRIANVGGAPATDDSAARVYVQVSCETSPILFTLVFDAQGRISETMYAPGDDSVQDQ